MSQQILRIIPNDTRESLIANRTTRTKVLYTIIVFLLFLIIGLLPFIKVSLSVQGQGIIRPISEKTEIKTNISQIVYSINIKEGQYVKSGDTILTFNQNNLVSRQQYLLHEHEKIQQFIEDLQILSSNSTLKPKSPLYLQKYKTYKKKLIDLDNKIHNSMNELSRNEKLFAKEIISTNNYNDLENKYQQLLQEKSILKSTQLMHWKSELTKYYSEVFNFENQLKQLSEQYKFYIITSPINGTIEEFSGIYEGSTLQTGQLIAIISPKSEKIAEIYLSAKDIGCLSIGHDAIIQVDAFNYNQWGVLKGKIIDISGDFILVNDTPVFKVKCRLEKNYLELKNGLKGNIKKGMTVNSRFIIAKRSLFQLLYQKSDDWLNPSRS